MGRTVLMIAYHLPPAMGSGYLRTLGFARYLPASGWDPVVLSVRASAYPHTAAYDGSLIPPDCPIHRTLAFDARRHFGIGGRYPAILAQPDRWASWWPAAVWQGSRLIRRHRASAIWSTYPIMTAHCIAHSLRRIAKIPWVADFRDPVAGSVEAGNPFSVASQKRWERRVVRSATRTVFTTLGAMRACAEHYPDIANEGGLDVIGNGYDDAAFAGLPEVPRREPGKPLTLVHSGLLYAEGRNPVPFLTALSRLKNAGRIDRGTVRVVLRASGFDLRYGDALRGLGVDDLVVLAPRVSNREALEEQARADALLLFQGHKFDRQIPAKVYEYLRIGRPIFALVGEHGDTADLLRGTGGAEMAPLDDPDRIEPRLFAFIEAVRAGRAPRVSADTAARYSRSHGAALLAGLLDRIAA